MKTSQGVLFHHAHIESVISGTGLLIMVDIETSVSECFLVGVTAHVSSILTFFLDDDDGEDRGVVPDEFLGGVILDIEIVFRGGIFLIGVTGHESLAPLLTLRHGEDDTVGVEPVAQEVLLAGDGVMADDTLDVLVTLLRGGVLGGPIFLPQEFDLGRLN